MIRRLPVIICILLFLLNLLLCDAQLFFHRGRYVGSYLEEPDPMNVQSSAGVPVNDSWFEQNLDHFDPQSNVTWQQVSLNLFYFRNFVN